MYSTRVITIYDENGDDVRGGKCTVSVVGLFPLLYVRAYYVSRLGPAWSREIFFFRNSETR